VIITEDEKVTLFDEEFIIKKDTPTSDRMSGFHNNKQITETYTNKFEVLRDIVMYYEDNYMSLQNFIENINIGSKTWVDEDPDNRFVASLSADVKYWSTKGITTVVQLRHYLDNEFEFAT
jgi:hypothetical protein